MELFSRHFEHFSDPATKEDTNEKNDASDLLPIRINVFNSLGVLKLLYCNRRPV